MKQDGDRISFSNQGRQEFVWPFWDSLETWSPGQVPVPVLGSRIVECSCCRQIQAKMTSVCNLYRREEKAALQKGSSSLSPIEKSDGGGVATKRGRPHSSSTVHLSASTVQLP